MPEHNTVVHVEEFNVKNLKRNTIWIYCQTNA